MKSGFRHTINWNKYQLKVSKERPNQYLDYLIDPSFQGLKRLLVLSFENNLENVCFFLFKSFLFYLISIQFFITLKLKKRKEKTIHKAEISKKKKTKTKTTTKKKT